tara:strand:- start:99 stop:254 length:156 start_codon:yes stop_codon:yes gene_type:complete
MTTFKRKETLKQRAMRDDLPVHTKVRLKKKKQPVKEQSLIEKFVTWAKGKV